jgi:hypothetical protein
VRSLFQTNQFGRTVLYPLLPSESIWLNKKSVLRVVKVHPEKVSGLQKRELKEKSPSLTNVRRIIAQQSPDYNL